MPMAGSPQVVQLDVSPVPWESLGAVVFGGFFFMAFLGPWEGLGGYFRWFLFECFFLVKRKGWLPSGNQLSCTAGLTFSSHF